MKSLSEGAKEKGPLTGVLFFSLDATCEPDDKTDDGKDDQHGHENAAFDH